MDDTHIPAAEILARQAEGYDQATAHAHAYLDVMLKIDKQTASLAEAFRSPVWMKWAGRLATATRNLQSIQSAQGGAAKRQAAATTAMNRQYSLASTRVRTRPPAPHAVMAYGRHTDMRAVPRRRPTEDARITSVGNWTEPSRPTPVPEMSYRRMDEGRTPTRIQHATSPQRRAGRIEARIPSFSMMGHGRTPSVYPPRAMPRPLTPERTAIPNVPVVGSYGRAAPVLAASFDSRARLPAQPRSVNRTTGSSYTSPAIIPGASMSARGLHERTTMISRSKSSERTSAARGIAIPRVALHRPVPPTPRISTLQRVSPAFARQEPQRIHTRLEGERDSRLREEASPAGHARLIQEEVMKPLTSPRAAADEHGRGVEPLLAEILAFLTKTLERLTLPPMYGT